MSEKVEKKNEVLINRDELKAIMEKNSMVIPKNIGDKVMNSIVSKSENGRLTLPKDYNVGNALLGGWVDMQDANNFDKSTDISRIEALVDMTLMAHYPKKHGYFIVYANKMTWFPKYTGRMFTINRALGIEISAQVIYQDDEFTYDMNDGIITNIKHKQEFKNIKKDKMVGAYAIAVDQETREFNRAEVMNMDQIKESWSKSRTDKDKKKHTEQYAKRSVLNRLSTWFIETQDIENGLIDVAVKNEQKHYDYEEVEVVDETQKVISFETKEETTPHNEDTGEVVEEVGDCLRCEFEPCSRRTVDVDDKLSKASMETPGCFSDERESDKSFKNVEA